MFNKIKAFKSVTLVSAGNMLNALLGFVFLTGVAKHLEISDFGKYALLTGLLTLYSRILDFGTNSLFVSSNDKESESHFLTTKSLLFLTAIPLSLVTLNILNLDTMGITTAFIAGLCAYGINYFLYAFYQKEQRYFEIVLLNSIPSVIKAGFGFALFTNAINFNLENCFAVFALSVFSGFLVKTVFPINIGKSELNFRAAIENIKSAVSPGISQLIFESWQTVNNLITKFFNTYIDVGIFSMANKISNIFTLISYSVFTVLLPKNSARNKQNKKYDFGESAILTIAILMMSVIAIIVSRIFLRQTFGDKFEESIRFLGLLIIASALTAIQNFMENYFYVHSATRYLVKINLLKLATLIVLAFWLIPSYGLYSLAISNVISALVGMASITIVIFNLEKQAERQSI